MNIFNALSQGYGSITETNFTSFLCYLLTDRNECKNYVFIEFLRIIEKQLNELILKDLFKINSNNIRETSNSFNNYFQYSVEPEKTFADIRTDIFIRVYDKANSEKDLLYIIIEAKIAKSSVRELQLNEQVNKFKETDEYSKSAKIIPILLSPNDEYFKKCFNEINEKICWLNWSSSENSIVNLLRILIEYETYAKIEPIDFSTNFLIKSFIDFIEQSFSKSTNLNYSVAGISEKEKIEFELDGNKYILRRFQNNMIRIYDTNENIQNMEVKSILKKINTQYNLNVSLGKKNTRILGRDIIKNFKEKIFLPAANTR